MDSKSLQEHAKRVALELPFTEHCWPFGPEFDVFKVGGKIFMIVAVAHGRPHVSLKSDPEKSLLNQQIYAALSRGIISIKSTGFHSTAPTMLRRNWWPISSTIPGIWSSINCRKKTRNGSGRADCSSETNRLSAQNALIFSRFAR